MARDLIVLRSGPTRATVRRDVALPGGNGVLFTIVAVTGAHGGALPNDAPSVQRDLAGAVAGTVAASKGSATARVRGAIDHAHALLRQRRAVNPAAEAVAASVGVLLLIGEEAILALVGPWLAYSLDARGAAAVATADQAPLGVEEPWADAGGPPPIDWSQLRLEPGSSVLVAPVHLHDVFTEDLLSRLGPLPPEELGERLGTVIPPDDPALFVARPSQLPRPTGAAAPAPVPADRATEPPSADEPDRSAAVAAGAVAVGAAGAGAAGAVVAAGVGGAANASPGASPDMPPGKTPGMPPGKTPPPGGRPRDAAPPTPEMRGSSGWDRATSTLRAAAVAAVLLSARVVRGMLPARSAPDDYREDWARVAAAIAIALPIGAVLLALAMRSLAGGQAGSMPPDQPADTTPAAPSSLEADAADATAAAGSDGATPLDGTARLDGLEKTADLMGAPADARRVVAVDGLPFVLNVETDSVEHVSPDGTSTVLARGQVVGDETVAELLDLFWLPAPGGGEGGRVAALDAAGRLWALTPSTVALVDRWLDPQWGAVSIAAGYDGNFYALDRSSGQIYRYSPDASGFPSYLTPGLPWLGQPEPLAAAVDMAIDGAIYVLTGDGAVHKRVAGLPDDSPSLVAARTTDAPSLYTSPTAGKLLLADRANGRVVVLTADGAPDASLIPPSSVDGTPGRFRALHDMWWDESGGRLFVVDGDELLQAPYH